MALAPRSWSGASSVPRACLFPPMDLLVLMISSVLFSALFLCEFFWKPFCLFLGVWSLILVLWKSTCTVNYLLTYREKDKDYLKHTVGCLFFSLERVYNLVCLMLG